MKFFILLDHNGKEYYQIPVKDDEDFVHIRLIVKYGYVYEFNGKLSVGGTLKYFSPAINVLNVDPE